MKRFSALRHNEQFKWANVVPEGCNDQDVYTAVNGIKPSDTYFKDERGRVKESNPYLFVRTMVVRQVWE